MLTSVNLSFCWPLEVEQVFLRQKYTLSQLLFGHSPNSPLCNASDTGEGTILSSQCTGSYKQLHPCAFFSLCHSPLEHNNEIGNGELLAVKIALEDWKHCMEGDEQLFDCMPSSYYLPKPKKS